MHESAYMNMKEYINIFKALSDNTRLRIMRLLIHAGRELCVCEIVDSLQVSQYNVSRHLKNLKIAGLIKERKDGRWVFYSVTKSIGDFQKLILNTVKSIPGDIFSMDIERLNARLSLREGEKCVIGFESKEWEKALNQLLSKGGRKYVQKT